MAGDLNCKINRVITPYIKEARAGCFIELGVLSLIFLAVEYALKNLKEAFLLGACIGVVYICAEYFLNYRVAVEALKDAKKQNVISEEFELKSISMEMQFSGRYESLLTKMYPKKLNVCRYCILCLNAMNQSQKLRTVMSIKKFNSMFELISMVDIVKKVKITYLKRSKIIISIELMEKPKCGKSSLKRVEKMLNLIDIINTPI